MSAYKNIIGEKFNKLTVIAFDHKESYIDKHGKTRTREYFRCQCDCGKYHIVQKRSLISGCVKSCGCIRNLENIPKELLKSRLHGVYKAIKRRCYTVSNSAYPRYGGRGITMCKEWKESFMSFYKWAMANGYDETAPRNQCTIDRIDNDGNYCPENCRWVNNKVQSNNRSNNTFVTYHGRSQTITQWAEELGINRRYLSKRIHSGDDIETVLKYPKLLNSKTRILEYNGVKKTLSQWADEYDIERGTLYNRLFVHGMSIDRALTYKKEVKKYRYKDKDMTIDELSKYTVISKSILSQRLDLGWDVITALITPVKTAKTYTYKNKTKTVREWAEYFGISTSTVKYRLKKFSEKEAFEFFEKHRKNS